MEDIEKIKLIRAWTKSSKEDFATAKELFNLKRYSGCLFFCHLAIEKILKALFLKKNNTYPPPTHKLVRLANLSKIKIDKQTEKYLAEITTFNVEARYDILKQRLYKKASETFTKKYLKITTELIVYFKKLL
jgi:HEPN domain-containing protein